MTAVFLFCNFGYGKAFLEQFLENAKSSPDVQHIVVISPPKASSCHRRFIFAARLQWQAWRYRSSCVVRTIRNVNSRKFIESVPNGSIGVIAGFNQIFHDAIILRFSDLVNFHPSILPSYRGAIPSYWAIRNGELRSGFTLHKVTRQIDVGPILFQEYVDIAMGDDEESLDRKISTRASLLLGIYLDTKATGGVFSAKVLPSPYMHSVDYVSPKRIPL